MNNIQLAHFKLPPPPSGGMAGTPAPAVAPRQTGQLRALPGSPAHSVQTPAARIPNGMQKVFAQKAPISPRSNIRLTSPAQGQEPVVQGYRSSSSASTPATASKPIPAPRKPPMDAGRSRSPTDVTAHHDLDRGIARNRVNTSLGMPNGIRAADAPKQVTAVVTPSPPGSEKPDLRGRIRTSTESLGKSSTSESSPSKAAAPPSLPKSGPRVAAVRNPTASDVAREFGWEKGKRDF